MKLLLLLVLTVVLVTSVARSYAIGRARGVPLRAILSAGGEQTAWVARTATGLLLVILLGSIGWDAVNGDFSTENDGRLMVLSIFFAVLLWAMWPRRSG
ncbi:hypothetical protein BH18ACT15_BH18ACT15_11140 [soil metagenome]